MIATLRSGLAALALATLPLAAPPAAHAQGVADGGIGALAGLRVFLRDLSPEGRETMRAAFAPLADDDTRPRIRALRVRMLDTLAAERLDVAALERAMLEERALSQGAHARVQSAMLQAIQRLSPADRRVLAAALRNAGDRRGRLRERLRERRQAAQPR